MEIKTTQKIVDENISVFVDPLLRSGVDYDVENENKKWVAVDSILDDLEAAIDKGNITIDGRKGFKASLWVSDLKKKLKYNKINNWCSER